VPYSNGLHLSTLVLKRREGVINTPASYSGDLGFKSQLRDPAILTKISLGFC
jgi:hypothetical protein